jgi:hypothetical protein
MNMKKKSWFVFIVLFFLTTSLYSQGEKFKALFMYNFTKYLEWPDQKKQGDFVIGVFGNSPIIDELNVIAQKRKVGAQQIKVEKISTLEEIQKCHIVYFPDSRSAKFTELKSNFGAKGIVFITDKPGLGKDSGINYVSVNGKQNFEVNKGNLEGQGIKINSALLSLGIIVK